MTTLIIRRVLWTAAVVAVLALATVLVVRVMTHSTIAFGQKCRSGNCWGYRLEQYGVSKQVVLTITRSGGMQQEYELPRTLLERAGEDRWLAGDRAVYLNFHATPADDPGAKGTPLRLLYDFQRGQLYIDFAQHAPDSHKGDATGNWLSEEEFQSAVTQIEP